MFIFCVGIGTFRYQNTRYFLAAVVSCEMKSSKATDVGAVQIGASR